MKKYGFIKFVGIVIALIFVMGLFCSCESGVANDSGANITGDYEYSDTIPGGTVSKENTNIISERKLIQNVTLTLQTNEYDAFTALLSQEIDSVGGYIESQRENMRTTRNFRYANYTIRIPSEKLTEFLATVSEIATVTSKSSSVNDITDNYIDTESRIAALEAEHTSLLALLDKAEKLADIININERIAEVQGELDSYKARLEAYDNQVTYATVSMDVSEVERTDEVDKGFWETVGDNLSDNFEIVGDGLRAFAIFLFSALPFILVVAVIGAVVLIIIFIAKRARRNKNKSEE